MVDGGVGSSPAPRRRTRRSARVPSRLLQLPDQQGLEARLGALLLCLLLIPVTVMYHPFWRRPGAGLKYVAAALGVAR